MVTRPGTRDEIDEFADAIGEWLLTQQFGSIKPLAFRHRMGWSDGDDDSYVVIELLVSDPPPDPETGQQKGWRAIRDEAANTTTIESYVSTWPLEDWQEVRSAAAAKGLELGPPDGIRRASPVFLFLHPESEGLPE